MNFYCAQKSLSARKISTPIPIRTDQAIVIAVAVTIFAH
jgi:hypothetical protein